MAASDWFTCDNLPDGKIYNIKQDKFSPLKIWAVVGGAAFLSLSLLLFFEKSNIAIVLFLLLLTFFLSIYFIVLTVICIPISLYRKEHSSFSIKNGRIYLLDKIKRNYPDQINISDISHLYYGVGGRSSANSHVIITGNSHVAAGALFGELVAQSGFGVWVNVRGDDIYLANALSEARAQYLYNDISKHIGFN